MMGPVTIVAVFFNKAAFVVSESSFPHPFNYDAVVFSFLLRVHLLYTSYHFFKFSGAAVKA